MGKESKYEELGTKLSGFSSGGPFHCADCIHREGNYCVHPTVVSDPALEDRVEEEGVRLYNINSECCRFVRPSEVTNPVVKASKSK